MEASREIQLSDYARRLVTRGSFFALCIIPTCWVCTLCLTPTARQIQPELQSKLGLPLEIMNARLIRPSTARAAEILIHVDAQRTASLEDITLEQQPDRIRWHAKSAEIPLNGLRDLLETVLARQLVSGQNDSLMLRIDRLKLQSNAKEIELLDVRLRGQQDGQTLVADASFCLGTAPEKQVNCHYVLRKSERPTDDPSSRPATTGATNEHEIPGDQTQFENRTEIQWSVLCPETDLPVQLLSAFSPGLARLGPQASFRGHIQGESGFDDKVQMEGTLADVDARSLIEPVTGRICRGLLNVELLQPCVWQDGRLQECSARVDCPALTVDAHFLRTLGEFRFRTSATATVQQLADFNFGFSILQNKLKVWGSTGEQTMARNLDNQAAIELPQADISLEFSVVQFLARMMMPEQGMQIPATADSLEVFRHLLR